MKEEDVAGLRVADLKEELKKRGLATSGLKAALAERLLESIKQENGTVEDGKDAPEDQQAKAAEEVTSTDKPAPTSQNSEHPEAITDSAAGKDAKIERASGEKENGSEKAAVKGAVTEQGQQHAAEDDAVHGAAVADDAAVKDTAMEEAQATLQGEAAGEVEAVPEEAAAKDTVMEEAQGGAEGRAVEAAAPVADGKAPAQPSGADQEDEAAPGEDAKPSDDKEDLPEGSASPQPRHRELAAERPEAPAPAPVPDAVEEEVDYEADEVDDVAAAPEEPAPHEARRPRANSESKSAAEVKTAARKAKAAGSRERGAGDQKKSRDAEEKPDGKEEAAAKDSKRKRAPIPVFVPRGKRAEQAANGDNCTATAAPDALEREAKLARMGSNDKRSVFERLKSGSGEEGTARAADKASDAPARRAPPSREATSRALLITGFIRPFTEKQARQMLSDTGEITGFWMTKIKDRAFVVYATEEQAEATRHAVMGIEWPLGNGNSLRPKFVPVEDAEETIKTGVPQETQRPAAPAAATAQVAAAVAAAAEPASRAPNSKPVDDPVKTKSLDARAILEERRKAREARSAPALQQDVQPDPPAIDPMEEDQPKTLEDLFRKTTTKPWLYWLPLTKEQIAEKAKKDAASLPGPPKK
ncbi:g1864 [Coccomyxa elongata]